MQMQLSFLILTGFMSQLKALIIFLKLEIILYYFIVHNMYNYKQSHKNVEQIHEHTNHKVHTVLKRP